MARDHPIVGSDTVRFQISEPLDVLKWGYRLLYVQLSIFVIMSMFYFSNPVTLAYLGAILSLFYIARIWKDYTAEEEGEIPESNWCTLLYILTNYANQHRVNYKKMLKDFLYCLFWQKKDYERFYFLDYWLESNMYYDEVLKWPKNGFYEYQMIVWISLFAISANIK